VSRLLYLVNAYCSDINSIVRCLNKVKGYKKVATELFFIFGKKNSNPLKDISNFEKFISSADPFSYLNCKKILGSNISTLENYKLFIRKLSVYWIYRIRCSIAHNKIGEYLMSLKDEKFVTDFGFPLLQEIISQCFK
jgi:hypothetical protein